MTNSTDTRFQMMQHVRAACLSCRMCELGWCKAKKHEEEYDPHVFSNYGPIFRPKFMVVGQNPGWNEVVKGEPFVGPAGENFDRALIGEFHQRDGFYITNACKCHTEGNRTPTAAQLMKCEPFLRMEVQIVKPKLVITLGSIALSVLCPGVPFTSNIGKILTSEKFDVKVYPTYHPSPVNLSDKSRKQQFCRDIKVISKIINHYLSPF